MTKKYRDKYNHHYLLIDISCQFNDVGIGVGTLDLVFDFHMLPTERRKNDEKIPR